MEARRYGFGASMPPANKFDPTDEDIVAYYLLPRAIGLPNPHAHAVIDDDPYGCPPWELLRRHGHAGSDHAFFFAPPRAPGKRADRVVSPAPGEDDGGVGGRWDTQKSTESSVVLVRGGGTAKMLPIKYRRCNLSYYHGDEPGTTSGWVMHEYQITAPPELSASSTVLARVRVTDRGKQRQRLKQKQAAVPDTDEPGPSNVVHGGHDDDDDHDDGNALGLSGGERSEVAYVGDATWKMAVYYVLDDGDSYLDGGSGYYQDLAGDGDYCVNVGESCVDLEFRNGGSES